MSIHSTYYLVGIKVTQFLELIQIICFLFVFFHILPVLLLKTVSYVLTL